MLCLCISISGMAVAWVAGIYVSCLFIESCFRTLGLVDSLKVISSKSIFITGILISIVFTFFASARMS
jgi:hypothetical protein